MRYDYLYLRVCPSDRPFNFCAIMETVLLYPISFALLFKNIWMKSDWSRIRWMETILYIESLCRMNFAQFRTSPHKDFTVQNSLDECCTVQENPVEDGNGQK